MCIRDSYYTTVLRPQLSITTVIALICTPYKLTLQFTSLELDTAQTSFQILERIFNLENSTRKLISTEFLKIWTTEHAHTNKTDNHNNSNTIFV